MFGVDLRFSHVGTDDNGHGTAWSTELVPPMHGIPVCFQSRASVVAVRHVCCEQTRTCAILHTGIIHSMHTLQK